MVQRSPVLLLGASGFVGRRLVSALRSLGKKVFIVRRAASSRWPSSGVETFTLPGNSYEELGSITEGRAISAIINCAAYGVHPSERDPRLMRAVNIDLPASLPHIARKCGASLIHIGSCSEYAAGYPNSLLKEDSAPERSKLYGSSKYEGGRALISHATTLGVSATVLRPFNIYGPGEGSHRLLPTLVASLAAGQRASLSPGSQVRDFVFIDDVISAIIVALDALQNGSLPTSRAYNVCTGVATTVREFAELVARELGSPSERLGFGDFPLRQDDLPWLVGDNSNFQQATGWVPRFSLAKGIHVSTAEMLSKN